MVQEKGIISSCSNTDFRLYCHLVPGCDFCGISKSKHGKIPKNLQNNAGETEERFAMWAVCFSVGISVSPPDFMLRNQSVFQPALERLDLF